MMSKDVLNDGHSAYVRDERLLDCGPGEVVSLLMPLRSGMWYAMVQDEGCQRRADMSFHTREGAEFWVLDVLEGVALERALRGEHLTRIDLACGEAIDGS